MCLVIVDNCNFVSTMTFAEWLNQVVEGRGRGKAGGSASSGTWSLPPPLFPPRFLWAAFRRDDEDVTCVVMIDRQMQLRMHGSIA